MTESTVTRRLAVFLGVIAVVVALGVGASLVLAPDEPEPEDDIFDPDDLLPAQTEASGDVEVDVDGSDTRILIDDAHTNRFSHDEIEPFVSALLSTGAEVEYVDRDMILEEELAEADAYIVIDPGREFTARDRDTVESFAADGNQVILAANPSHVHVDDFGAQELNNLLNSLALRFDMQFGAGYLYNLEENDGNFHNIYVDGQADGIDGVAHLSTWVVTEDGEHYLTASPEADRSTTDERGPFPVAAVDGSVMALGTTSFFEADRYNVDNNEEILADIVRFAVTGETS